VSGQKEGLAQLPDGEFLPPMALNCAEQHVRQRMQERFGRDRVLTIGRVANLTAAHNGRAPLSLLRTVPPRMHHAGRISAASTPRCPRRARPAA